MSDAAAATAPAASPSKAKKPRAPKGTAKKVIPTHPPTAQMVNAAIKNLKERGGSSLQAIKKYIAATYKIDAEKLAPFIRKYLKKAVTDGKLVQTKGKGAAGSFKLSQAVAAPKKEKKAVKPKKAAGEKKAKSPKKVKVAAKKPKTPKKTVKAVVEKKAAAKPAAKKPKSPKKEKKPKAVAKPKTPKAKKPAAKKPAAKKTAAKKAAPKK
jgi:histone H1/5